MVDDGIPAELRDFITKSIDSVGQLEALLLLRNNADETWDVAQLTRRLYVHETEAAAILTHLVEQGFVIAQDGSYRYDRQGKQAAVVDQLAEAYARQLIPITNVIHSKPRGIRAFADAFKIKRDK
jgi:ABC-type transporter Mla maintaining outer membrane lipid asymmetry permease subunit MlaE